MMFLLPMLMACVGGSRDSGNSGGNSGDSENGIEDPRWFEAGSKRCVTACFSGTTFTLTQTGSISDYEIQWDEWEEGYDLTRTLNGECLIGDAITPDESVWEATCDGLSDVTVYSEGFRIDFTYSRSGNPITSTWE